LEKAVKAIRVCGLCQKQKMTGPDVLCEDCRTAFVRFAGTSFGYGADLQNAALWGAKRALRLAPNVMPAPPPPPAKLARWLDPGRRELGVLVWAGTLHKWCKGHRSVMLVSCPYSTCRAALGEPCRGSSGKTIVHVHVARAKAAKMSLADAIDRTHESSLVMREKGSDP
jgi:hypothetical protein